MSAKAPEGRQSLAEQVDAEIYDLTQNQTYLYEEKKGSTQFDEYQQGIGKLQELVWVRSIVKSHEQADEQRQKLLEEVLPFLKWWVDLRAGSSITFDVEAFRAKLEKFFESQEKP